MSTSSSFPGFRLTNLTLRDGQQSTLDAADWIFKPRDYAKVILASARAGFDGAEIAGGQSFQIAIGRGYNPFTVLGAVSHAVKSSPAIDEFELQMLFRGANALGFRHYDKDVIEITLKEFIKHGISKIRFFDALNDIDNLQLPESIQSVQGVVLEGAICFTHYTDAPDRYTDDYFCNYTQELLDAGYNAIAIKDMSGQLTAERIATLVPALLEILTPKNIPLTLHCHSTHTENSRAAVKKATEFGIHAIETTEGSLTGGSAHHSLEVIAPDRIENADHYRQMTDQCVRLWGRSPARKDEQIPQHLKEQLCAAGVPGGAMPFVIRDLEQQESTIRAKYLSSAKTPDEEIDLDDFSTIVDLFIRELKRVCADAGLPLLVTPTADICCKQAIANLALGADPYADTLAERYLNRGGQPNPDPRFAKLILGYYGDLKAYDQSGSVHGATPEVIQFFETNNALQLKQTEQHPSKHSGGDDLREAQQAAWQLIQKKGADALSFGSFDQLTILYALKPAGIGQSDDPIAKAVDTYLQRSEKSRIDGQGRTFPGYENLMQPILNYLGAMFALDRSLEAEDIPHFPLRKLGNNLCSQLYDVYIDLPIWKNVTVLGNHLSQLLSSKHISKQLLDAVHHVSETLIQLDARPTRHEKKDLADNLAKFKELTIADLFNSLALINAFINDVAKYATNPKVYASRSIEMSDLAELSKPVRPSQDRNSWEARIQQSITGRYIRLENDFRRRAEYWRG